MTQTIAATTERVTAILRGMPMGKRYGVVDRAWCREAGFSLCVHRSMAPEYELDASYPLMEAYDEDPGSIVCGCPWQGESHAHARRAYVDAAECAAAYATALDELRQRKQLSFARAERVG